MIKSTRMDRYRSSLIVFHDVVATALAWLVAYWLRFNLTLPGEFVDDLLLSMLWVVPRQICSNHNNYKPLHKFNLTPAEFLVIRR